MNSRNLAPSALARWFVNHVDRDAGDDITHLKLQKLLYYAQAWWLANTGESLFEEDMQAWTHGPVVPSVWHAYRDYGWNSLPPQEEARLDQPDIDRYLRIVYEKYGKYSAKYLEDLTHQEEPWKQTRGTLPLEAKCTKPIDKEIIRSYYSSRINAA